LTLRMGFSRTQEHDDMRSGREVTKVRDGGSGERVTVAREKEWSRLSSLGAKPHKLLSHADLLRVHVSLIGIDKRHVDTEQIGVREELVRLSTKQTEPARGHRADRREVRAH
jgi:hypothetical protein